MERLKILVVDDESRMRKLVRDFLVKKDFEVLEAGDGEEAFFAGQINTVQTIRSNLKGSLWTRRHIRSPWTENQSN